MRSLFSVIGLAAATLAVVAARPATTRSAAPRGLTFSPSLATSGARIAVTYQPAGTLASERSLVLRGRFRPGGVGQIVAVKNVVVATLQRSSDGSFRGTFVFPDSVVIGSFAVEDSAAQRVDANGGKLWQLLTRTAKGQPSYSALIQSAYDHYGYWGLALESNRLATKLYPDSIDGWATLRFHENVALGTSGPEVDSLAAWHKQHFAQLHAQYAKRKELAPTTIARLYDYGAYLKDTAITGFWRARLLTEATGTRTAAQQRGVATLTQYYRDHNTAAALAAFERYWPEANGTHSQLPGWALRVAVESNDTVVADRWVERMREEGASESSIASQLRSMPARRSEALAMQRRVLARYDADNGEARALDQTANDRRKARLKSRAQALSTMGDILASMGQVDAAIDTLDRAARVIMSPDLFRSLGDLRLKKSDTTGAARDFAIIAADPSASLATRDSLRTRLGWSAADSRWTAQLDSAAGRVMPLILADAVNWLPAASRVSDAAGKRLPLASLVSGAPTVLIFWATNCGPCVGEIPDLVRLVPSLEAKGVKVVSVTTDDVPSPVMQKFIASKRMNYSVYYDLQHEASNAFGVVGIPATFVLDATGRVRFALSELSQVPRQLETIR